MHRNLTTGTALAILTAVASLLLHDRAFILIDEGHIATIAARILNGEVIYRDVQTGIFPGVYYLTAALFAVFGEDIVYTRLAQVGVNVLTVLVLWRLGTRSMSRRWALFAPVVYCAMISIGFPVYVMFAYSGIALLFGLAALLATYRYLESGHARDGIAAGALLALCALTKQNYGAFFGIGIAAGLVWARSVSQLADRKLVTAFAPVVLSGATVTCAVLLPLLMVGAGPRLLQYCLLTIFDSQLTAFDQPLPNVFADLPMNDGRWAFLYSPGLLFNYLMRGELLLGFRMSQELREWALRLGYGLALAPLFLAPIARVIARNEHSPLATKQTDILVLTSILSFFGIFPSAIWSHLVAVLPPLLLLGALVAHSITSSTNNRVMSLVVDGTATAGLVLLAIIAGVATLDLRRWNSEPTTLPQVSLRVTPDSASVLRDSVAFLEDCADPGDPIYVAPDITGVFFLTDRANPTPYDILIPGDIDDIALISELNKTGTDCIVYNPRMYIHFRELSLHFPMFTHFVETEFEPVAQLGSGNVRWQVLRRRNLESAD